MHTTIPYPKISNQYLAGLVTVCFVSMACLFTRDSFSYQVTAYVLLATVSLLAIFLELYPVLLCAILSALVLDFLFIKPYYTFHINSAEDFLLLLLFFIIALVNGVLTHKIRKAEQMARIRETRINTMKLYNTLMDSLSHELRTPIATIIGSLGNLQDDKNLSENNRKQLLAEMEKASLRLNRQVENLLNMSRLESGFIHPKADWTDIPELLYNVVNQLSAELEGHKITILHDELPLFKLDYGLTEQIIYNLVYNASLHTPQGAEIAICAAFAPAVDFESGVATKTCIITIADDGNGFPEADLEKVFDKFYRSANAKTGGTGLGLSIVKGFVEAQQGDITLENKPTGGALFTVSFPAPILQTNAIGNE